MFVVVQLNMGGGGKLQMSVGSEGFPNTPNSTADPLVQNPLSIKWKRDVHWSE